MGAKATEHCPFCTRPKKQCDTEWKGKEVLRRGDECFIKESVLLFTISKHACTEIVDLLDEYYPGNHVSGTEVFADFADVEQYRLSSDDTNRELQIRREVQLARFYLAILCRNSPDKELPRWPEISLAWRKRIFETVL